MALKQIKETVEWLQWQRTFLFDLVLVHRSIICFCLSVRTSLVHRETLWQSNDAEAKGSKF